MPSKEISTINTLDELFKIARQYGLVTLSSMSSGRYYSAIQFNTIDHTKLQASSASDCETPEDALIQAIENAKKIVESIKDLANNLPDKKVIGSI